MYDKVLTLAFLERIRAEQKFPDVEALRAQVARDVARAAELLGEPPSRS
ncbi:MAG: riboflavin kinase [Candidatus Rokuibacteriota bacterium]